MKRFFLFFSLLLPSMAQVSQKDLDSFEKVWTIINEKHWDLKGTGVDWNQIHDKYLPLAHESQTLSELRQVIRDMIHELGQTHFGLLQAEQFNALHELEAKLALGSGVPAFLVEIVENRIMVVKDLGTGTNPNLPPGTEIKSVRGVKSEDIVSGLMKAYRDSQQADLYKNRVLQSYLSGSPGGSLPLEVIMPGGEKVVSKDVPLHTPAGISQTLGDLPPMTFNFNRSVLDDHIGLISFNIFLFPLTKQFPEALEYFKNCKGLIIDLRGNGGGIGFLASNLAGYLFKEKGKLGTMYSKDSEINFPVLPRSKTWDKPLAIIINGGSASTSEIFAAGIQDLGRGKVFGTTSAGAALPSFIEPLPNGDLFQYAFASYRSVKGRYLEGNGVQPDLATPHTLEMLRQGKDASIEAAKEWILKTYREKKNEK